MSSLYTYKETIVTEDADGNIEETSKERTGKIVRNTEPDFVKIYTKMWCNFNQIPDVYSNLFLLLVTNMTYCDAADLEHSQIVNTGEPWATTFMQKLGWKRAMYQRALKALCDCNAIRKVSRGVYQINPAYAGKGEWKYNPRLARGGVEDLVAQFDFSAGKVETKIVWADDSEDSEINKTYREGLNVKASDETVLKKTTIKASDAIELNDIYNAGLNEKYG